MANRIAADVKSATRAKKGMINQVFRGEGKFRSQKQQEKVISVIGPVASGSPSDKAELLRKMVSITDEMREEEHAESAPVAPAQRAPSEAIVRASLDLAGTSAINIEAAVKQLIWKPDFYIMTAADIQESERFRVGKEFLPATMTPRVTKLASVWTELCRFVLIQLGSDREFGTGFVFSHDSGAICARIDDESWLLVNPFKDHRNLKDLWSSTKDEDLAWLYAAAIHECTHLADNVHDHDEEFSTALTYNIARCAKGWRQVRAIEQSIKMGESRVAGTSREGVGAKERRSARAMKEAPPAPKPSESAEEKAARFAEQKKTQLAAVRRDAKAMWLTDATMELLSAFDIVEALTKKHFLSAADEDVVLAAVGLGGSDAFLTPALRAEILALIEQGEVDRMIAAEIKPKLARSYWVIANEMVKEVRRDQARAGEAPEPPPAPPSYDDDLREQARLRWKRMYANGNAYDGAVDWITRELGDLYGVSLVDIHDEVVEAGADVFGPSEVLAKIRALDADAEVPELRRIVSREARTEVDPVVERAVVRRALDLGTAHSVGAP